MKTRSELIRLVKPMDDPNEAIAALKAEGVEISKDAPLSFDLPYNASDSVYNNLANAFKQSIEKSFLIASILLNSS